MHHILEISTIQIPFLLFFLRTNQIYRSVQQTDLVKVLHCMPMFLFCTHSFEYSVLIIKSANEYKKKVSNQTDCYTLPGNSTAEKHDFTDL